MFIPSVKSKLSLILLMVIALACFIWIENSRIFEKQDFYQKKLEAAKLMKKAEEAIRNYRMQQDIYIDKVNDPNETALIGEKNTLITTDRGDLRAKLTALNPNMAAVMIDLLNKADVSEGDEIAVSCTGSFPGINIALFSAAKVMNLDLIIISSVGASMFGCTDPEFTWLDYETFFNNKGIFDYKSKAASIGGGKDLGQGLSAIGRDLIKKAIGRNNVQFVFEQSLEANIDKKMTIFRKNSQNPDLYVNIGGGLSSLGNSINGRLVSSGYHKYIRLKNIPTKGTMFLFADDGVPVIHLLEIKDVAAKYDLPIAPSPLPEVGEGKVFTAEKYNVNYAVIALIILIGLVIVILLFDKKQLELRHDEVTGKELKT